MKSIAFIFSHAPYGISHSHEGLETILSFSSSSINNKISLFFIKDGILHLIKKQYPDKIFLKNYIKTFESLSFFNIHKYFICLDSLKERGFKKNDCLLNKKFLDKSVILNIKKISKKLNAFNFIINF